MAQYVAWWIVNGRRTRDMQVIEIENIDPVAFINHMRSTKKNHLDTSVRKMTSEERKKIIDKLDRMYKAEQKNKK